MVWEHVAKAATKGLRGATAAGKLPLDEVMGLAVQGHATALHLQPLQATRGGGAAQESTWQGGREAQRLQRALQRGWEGVEAAKGKQAET